MIFVKVGCELWGWAGIKRCGWIILWVSNLVDADKRNRARSSSHVIL